MHTFWDRFLDAIETFLIPRWNIEAKSGRLIDDEWDTLRKSALYRDNYTCQGCGQCGIPLDVHHIIPVSRGGNNWLNNLLSLCRECHTRIHPWLDEVPHE